MEEGELLLSDPDVAGDFGGVCAGDTVVSADGGLRDMLVVGDGTKGSLVVSIGDA